MFLSFNNRSVESQTNGKHELRLTPAPLNLLLLLHVSPCSLHAVTDPPSSITDSSVKNVWRMRSRYFSGPFGKNSIRPINGLTINRIPNLLIFSLTLHHLRSRISYKRKCRIHRGSDHNDKPQRQDESRRTSPQHAVLTRCEQPAVEFNVLFSLRPDK
ncbi:hypothetical protein RRG08_054755 [Elysia crispata]|uniref:Uncharacterized protein n=1 Tax=Elysia crispata TaxID=231223 RepID=A0AAE1B112_9GAST|nr:hypothetical protein RRG08_054755 [Elysia crispata]